jgi:predicted nucleic acid-binding protein
VADPVRAFVDSNVFVYAFDADEPKKRKQAIALLAGLRSDGRVVVSTQVLLEFHWVTTRKLGKPLSREVARRETSRLAELTVVSADSALVLDAVARSTSSGISIWDAMIVEAALQSGCGTLYSEDLQDGWEIDGRLRVVNPFS